jgi:hypothetical protein
MEREGLEALPCFLQRSVIASNDFTSFDSRFASICEPPRAPYEIEVTSEAITSPES